MNFPCFKLERKNTNRLFYLSRTTLTIFQLLASLSSYAYVRRAWKKEAFDLLMDPQFFQMDLVCIGYWRTIIDHLMSYERVVFKDLMTR